jgi:putative glycosyltransferase (TIGR04348 family)
MLPKQSQRIAIITPALADAKNGNWQTARRWSFFIDNGYKVELSKTLDTIMAQKRGIPDALIGLHARRSAPAIKEFAAFNRPIAVVLTGTDLYGDSPEHPLVAESLEIADQIVVLQDEALKLLSPKLQKKARVIYQSAPTRKAGPFRQRTFDIAFVAHLRSEKDPDTVLNAMPLVTSSKLRLRHIGKLDDYAQMFTQAAEKDSRIQLLGALEHNESRKLLGQCRLLVISSKMEGGANVIIEAITNGTPVLASRISGNVGMLGGDYPGYFDLGDEAQLAALINKCMTDTSYLELLQKYGQRRARRFLPETEKRSVLQLVGQLLASPTKQR